MGSRPSSIADTASTSAVSANRRTDHVSIVLTLFGMVPVVVRNAVNQCWWGVLKRLIG